jgi:hypothetical protein
VCEYLQVLGYRWEIPRMQVLHDLHL